jgi:hypothetical protein
VLDAVTVYALVKFDSLASSGNYDNIVSRWSNAESKYNWGLEYSGTSGKITMEAQENNSKRASVGLSVNQDIWYYVVGTFDGTTNLATYVNSTTSTTKTSEWSAAATADTANLYIGNENGTKAFDGIISKIAVWNVVLTSEEITGLTQSGTDPATIQADHLTALWDFSDGVNGASADGQTITDDSTNTNDATGSDGANNTGLLWSLGGSCSANETQCNVDCEYCTGEVECNASTLTCYYWSTGYCRATQEPTTTSGCGGYQSEHECAAAPIECYWRDDTFSCSRQFKGNMIRGPRMSGVKFR